MRLSFLMIFMWFDAFFFKDRIIHYSLSTKHIFQKSVEYSLQAKYGCVEEVYVLVHVYLTHFNNPFDPRTENVRPSKCTNRKRLLNPKALTFGALLGMRKVLD